MNTLPRFPRIVPRGAWVAAVATACLGAMHRQGAAEVPPGVVEVSEITVGRHWPIDHATFHVQGLAADADSFWISSVDKGMRAGWIFRVSRRSMQVTAARRLADGARYHPGGMQRQGSHLWLPLAEYRPKSTTRVLKLSAETLETVAQFLVDDHLGAMAVAADGTLFAANWDARQTYVLALQGDAESDRRIIDSTTGVAYQDWEWHDGELWAAGLLRGPADAVAVVDVLDARELTLRRRFRLRGELRSGGTNFSREGFTRDAGSMLLLPEDGPHTTVYEFLLPRK